MNIFFIIFAQRNTVFRSLQTCLKYQVFDKFSRHEKKSCLSQTKKGSIVVYQLYKTHTTLGTFPVSSFCVRVCMLLCIFIQSVCLEKSEWGRWGELDWNVRAYSSLKFYQPYSHPTIPTHNFSLPQIFSLLPSSFSKTFHTHKFWRSEVMLLLLQLVLLLLHIVCYDQNVFKLSQYNLTTNLQLDWDIG